ncbi:sce7726 family protein [Myxococcaceae bacterium JPH2]|nr:sce7726 family protein [Myxococcaceae bacterium JPH2]
MHDSDVRPPLRQLVAALTPDALVLDELGLDHGRVRVDVATLAPDALHGYEIKADADTLRRLPGQVDAYSAALDRCTLVVGPAHLDAVTKLVPAWWGLMLARWEADTLELQSVRRGRRNPEPDAAATVRLLWRTEALALLESRNAAKGLRNKSKAALYRRLCAELPAARLRAEVRRALVARGDWRR